MLHIQPMFQFQTWFLEPATLPAAGGSSSSCLTREWSTGLPWVPYEASHCLICDGRAFRVMPYSTACTTPLSNFEAGTNWDLHLSSFVILPYPGIVRSRKTTRKSPILPLLFSSSVILRDPWPWQNSAQLSTKPKH